ncbi:hypothetical protein PMZ80_000640 [Knufia obscura]|uniref:Uncharacterized protein n=2 Tax=Knufia TaxID=430999 RepID=A0AAN8EE78_9EURO|nr:hypothetical protein PMZ80_000640 [Knufia obscura]KAK5948522.1 hypothetical protein OHC33_010418 [Knufia fluminis]
MAFTKLPLMLMLVRTSVGQDLFSSLLSDAQSIYAGVTSVLAPTTASASSSSSESTSTSSSSSSSSSTTSSTSASPTSSPSSTPSPTSSPASTLPSAANAASSSSGNGGNNNTLAIVLGCTLGALALAALLGLLYLCLRRRKRSKNSAKHRPISPDDSEIESWRHEKPRVRSLKGPDEHVVPAGTTASAAPLMTQRHSDSWGYQQHQNPFVPVPPPARRTGSRAGLEDTSYSAHPYSPEHVNSYGSHGYGGAQPNNHSSHALAAGLGGATLGGLASHARERHERKRSESRGRDARSDPSYSEDERNALPQVDTRHRRSGSVGRANAKEPWPFMDAQGRQSTDSARSRARSFSRSQEHFMTPDQHPTHSADMSSYPGFAGAAATGGLAGATVARKLGSHSPQRKGILKQTTSDSSNPSSWSSGTRSTPYVTNLENQHSGPHELDSTDVPTTPTVRERRDSGLGTAAPSAAATAIVGESRPRGGSGSRTPHNQPKALVIPPSPEHGLGTPRVPSRSPKRTSLDYRAARYSSVNEGTAELPVGTPKQEPVSPPLEPADTYAEDRDGLISPVSPITGSQPGTWSQKQAEEFRMSQAPLIAGANTTSQESTAVDSASPGHERESSEDSSSDQQSSGLVSAIQRIFNSQKTAWATDENPNTTYGRPRTAQRFQPVAPEEEVYDDKRAKAPIMSVPRRKPTPTRASLENNIHSHHGDIDTTSADPHAAAVSAREPETMPLQQPQPTQSFPDFRKSIESAHALPPRYRSRENSFTNEELPSTTSANDFAPTVTSPISSNTDAHPTNRPRATSKPGYGQGSGDPFDLARTRTDSSMTGISLSNYRSPNNTPAPAPAPAAAPAPVIASNHSRPWPQRTSSGEPTLAELRREVQEEDRARARRSSRAQQRKSRGMNRGSGDMRYGDDRELFDLVDQSLGRRSGSHEHDRFYGQDDGASSQKRNRRSSGGVGWAQ